MGWLQCLVHDTSQVIADRVEVDSVLQLWETVSADGGEAVSGGLEVLVLDDDGLIKTDYMFPGA